VSIYHANECGGGALSISSDGEYIGAGGVNEVCLLSGASHEVLMRWPTVGGTDSISISFDGRYVAAGGSGPRDSGWIAAYSTQSSASLWENETDDRIVSVAISSDGALIATQDIGGIVRVLSRSDGVILWSYSIGTSGAMAHPVAISSNGDHIVAGTTPGGGDPSVFLFSAFSETPIWSYLPPYPSEWIASVAISSNGEHIAAGDYAGRIYLFSRLQATPLWTYETSRDIYSVALADDGKLLVVGGGDGNVYLFSATSGVPHWVYPTGGPVYSVSISADGNHIAAGSQDGRVYLFSASSNTPLWSYQTEARIAAVSMASKGNRVAASNPGNGLHVLPHSIFAEARISTLAATPLRFQLDAGDSLQFSANLTSDGTPVEGCLVTWSATSGIFDPRSAETNAEGQVLARYTAPLVMSETAVTITITSSGGSRFASATATLQGVVTALTGKHREPISISNDDQFTTQNGVVGGAGTRADPFVIQGWVISATENAGIEIDNTQDHFVIRDVHIVGSGAHGNPHNGISLNHIASGRIENTIIEGASGAGIAVTDSSLVVIASNGIRGSASRGIQVSRTDGILIEGNTVSGSDDNGIELEELSEGSVVGNTVTDSTKHGIGLYSTNNCLVENNVSRRNGWMGIQLRGTTGRFGISSEYPSVRNTVRGNEISHNGLGPWGGGGILIKENSDNNGIEGNTVHDNDGSGIAIQFDADNISIRGNEVHDNFGMGIVIQSDSDDAWIEGNLLRHNGQDAILVDDSIQATLVDNTIVSDDR